MPVISERARRMPPSPIRKLVPLSEAAAERGVHVYHLNIGQPDVKTPPGMLDAYRNHDLTVLEYGHSGGLWSYRAGLARYYQSHGIEVTKEQVLVTTAGSEAILFALMAVMDVGDEVITPEPFYTNYGGFAVEAGVHVVPVTSPKDKGYCLPSDEEIRAAITPRTRAIMLCNPSNPTGYVYERAELERVKALCLEYDLFLISDEVYREFVFDGEHCSVFHLDGMDDRAILVDSISKRYSACGARVGCLVTRNEEVLSCVLRFGQARLCPPTLEQMAALAAIDTPAEYFEETLAEYRDRRDAAFEMLDLLPGVTGLKPRGAFYAVIDLPIDSSERFCAWLLSDFQDNGETVMLAPAGGFYATPGLGERAVRIAFVLNVESVRRSMEILGKALEAYPGRLAQSA